MFIYNFYNIGEKKKSIVALNCTYCNNNSKAFPKNIYEVFLIIDAEQYTNWEWSKN